MDGAIVQSGKCGRINVDLCIFCQKRKAQKDYLIGPGEQGFNKAQESLQRKKQKLAEDVQDGYLSENIGKQRNLWCSIQPINWNQCIFFIPRNCKIALLP